MKSRPLAAIRALWQTQPMSRKEPKGIKLPAHHVRDMAKATKKSKKRKKSTEDFNQTAFRIVQETIKRSE